MTLSLESFDFCGWLIPVQPPVSVLIFARLSVELWVWSLNPGRTWHSGSSEPRAVSWGSIHSPCWLHSFSLGTCIGGHAPFSMSNNCYYSLPYWPYNQLSRVQSHQYLEQVLNLFKASVTSSVNPGDHSVKCITDAEVVVYLQKGWTCMLCWSSTASFSSFSFLREQ